MIRGSLSQPLSCGVVLPPPATSAYGLTCLLHAALSKNESIIRTHPFKGNVVESATLPAKVRGTIVYIFMTHSRVSPIPSPLIFRFHSRDSFDGTTSSSNNSSSPPHNVIVIDNPTNALASDDVLGPIREQERETNNPTISMSHPSSVGAHSHCNRFTNAGRWG